MNRIKTLKIRNIVAVLFAALMAVSCASHRGNISSGTLAQANDFRVVGIAMGESGSTKVFGLGGFGKDALIYEAKKDLYLFNSLEKGQKITNFTVDYKTENYLFYSRLKVIVTAEIIEQTEASKGLANNYELLMRSGFQKGNKVYAKYEGKLLEAKIVKLFPDNAQLEMLVDDKKEVVNVKYRSLFKTSGSIVWQGAAYNIGENIKMIVNEPPFDQTIEWEVIAKNSNYALLKNTKNKKIKTFKL